MHQKLHLEILFKPQQQLFQKLNFFTDEYYMAGGTALALQIGHRTSLDFDIYSKSRFERNTIYNLLKNHFAEKDIIPVTLTKNTFIGKIDNINLSVFYYQYPLLKNPQKTTSIALASLEDIASMKLIAIIQRPAKRDYIDVYYLLKTFSIDEMFSFASQKYQNFNPYLALRALSYFEDIEKESLEKRGIKILDHSFSWQKIKEDITSKVKKYQLDMLK
ncbi:nucleotidyl transferase AbiEii/AbiGii toxin family protein [Candidatus Gottesmanbacteria bacterium]|nr:nucleotidyl transferase AbiEii/AbiGii toxin family protein [Candidatus Gottesmanbacteria bacterium]